MPAHSKGNRNSSKSTKTDPLVIVALLGLIGTLLAAIINSSIPVFLKWIERLPTPTAEMIFTPTQTFLETPIPTLTLIPTPTAWPLGAKTATDPKPLCSITVSDHQETNRENTKRVQFVITGQGGYCSWIIPLNGYDATSKKWVTFWVRGDIGGEQYEVGIKDIKTPPGQEPKVPETASTSWNQVSLSLRDSFKNQDLSTLENISLNFKVGSGTIYVDQLIFTP